MLTLPYRIETERLVVRRWEPRDAPLLKEAVDSSLDHLRPWMPGAHEDPQPLEAKVELLRRFRGQFDLGQDFVFGILSADESEVVGGTGLHARSVEGVLEIGYWLRASRVGRGFVEEGTLRRVLHGPDGTPLHGDAVVFALLREELAGPPVGHAELTAFDAAGNRLL